MPIKRKLAKEFDTWKRIVSLGRDAVRLIQHPLSDQGWENLISKELEIDIETSTHVFEDLVTEGVLIFTRTHAKRAIYINDRTPEFKKYMWSGDILK